MKKEQTLVLVAIAAAGLIVYSNYGLYSGVDAGGLGNESSNTESSSNVAYDPQTGLPVTFKEGRNLMRQNRTETRPPLPPINRPVPLPPTWVRLLPWPYPDAAHWAGLRQRIAEVPVPADEETVEDAGDPDPGDEIDETDVFAEKKRDPDSMSKFVFGDGRLMNVDLTPRGKHKGKPLWDVLRDWPNVELTVSELNANGDPLGSYPLNAEGIANQGLTTFHLPKTCENEYWEQRVRQRVAVTDRGSLMDLARWAMDTLYPKYGIEAVGFALRTMEEARALKVDLALARELAQLYRQGYDLEGELRVLQDFVRDGNENNPAALELLGDALARGGALGPAAARYEAAAATGSSGARLGLAGVKARMGDLDGARDAFRAVQSAGSVEEQARAHAGEATILIRQGNFKDALTVAQRGSQILGSDAEVKTVLGSALYYLGRFGEAEQAYRAAAALSPKTHTRARSNLGMALVAQDRLDAAMVEFQACLDSDPLNFFDPMVGLGDALQRQGRLTQANDRFETARVRAPSNAWILLRLGTAKLRDGVSGRALVLARAVVTAAPGCVDGLRLAGLAAGAEAQSARQALVQALDDASLSDEDRAALETTLRDFSEEALRHLERAMSKEPENIPLFRQYVMALLETGRLSDALKVLEKATATGTGFARRDGRTLLLHGYVKLAAGAEIDGVRERIDNALRTELDEPATEYAKELRTTINEWDALRIWVDEFRRVGPKLFGGWGEDDERHGIAIGVAGEHAAFAGSVRSSTEGRNATSLTRSEDAKKIREWETAFRIPSLDTHFVAHMYDGSLQELAGEDTGGRRGGRSGGELAFVVTRDGKMQIWSTGGGAKGKSGALVAYPIADADGNERTWPRDGAYHTVRFERTDHDEGTWQMYFDGETIGEQQKVSQLKSAKGRDISLGFQIDADRGTKVDVHVDRVQITRTVD